jgi:hypothetical protein
MSSMAAMIISRGDSNGDGKLSEDELPAERRGTFAEGDLNGDGFMDARELGAAISKRMSGGMAGGPPGGDAATPTAGGDGE